MEKYGPEKTPYLDTFHAVFSVVNDPKTESTNLKKMEDVVSPNDFIASLPNLSSNVKRALEIKELFTPTIWQ